MLLEFVLTITTQDTQWPRKRAKTSSMLQDGSLTPENAGEFPYFLNGDVAIAITNPAKTHIWHLHASILFNASDLLKEKLNPRDQSGIVRSTEGITTFLTLSNDEKPPQIPTLIARTLEEIPEQARRREQEAGPEDRRIPPAPASQATSIVSSVKTEGVGKQLTSHTPKFDAHVLSELCSAYDNLFRDIYGLPVLLQSESVHQSLFQAEVLVPIFRTYGQLASIRAQVENVFSQYRKKLFEAIMQDPVRWLNLSILLESSSIYTEAFVHLAGSLNSFLRTNTKSNIPPVVLAQLKRKDEKLKSAKEMVVGELSRLTVHVDGKPVKMGGSLETWITVQLFRGWLAVELDKIERQGADSSRRLSGDRVSGNSGTVPYGIGTLLRRIYRGGDAYLAYDKVIKEIKETFEFLGSDWEDLADDLRALKDYASRTVKKICSNNLMIDPESHKIPYLTCVDVAPNEFPWMLLAEGT